jgi:hypothetical protein
MIPAGVVIVEEHRPGRFHILEEQAGSLVVGIGLEDRQEAAVGLFVVVVVFVEDREVHEGVDVHRGAGADALIKLNRLGIVGLAVVEHGQAETGLLVVGVFVKGPLVEVHGPFMLAVGLGFLCFAEKFFGGPFVDCCYSKFAHRCFNPD